jgi:hypothetical protein
MPMSYQATVGYQFQAGDDWGFSADVVLSRTTNLPRLVDLNSISRRLTAADTANIVCASATSCPGDGLRPEAPTQTGYRRLSTAETEGLAEYAGLYLAARKRLSRGLTIDANYVLSRAMTDAEDINFSATQGNCFGEDRVDAITGASCNSTEWAVANNDRRHRVTVRLVWSPTPLVRVSAIGDLQSGHPFNRVAGVTVGRRAVALRPARLGAHSRQLVHRQQRSLFRCPAQRRTVTDLCQHEPGAPRTPSRCSTARWNSAPTCSTSSTARRGRGRHRDRRQRQHRPDRAPGDPIFNFTPGPPRQLQLSVGWRSEQSARD